MTQVKIGIALFILLVIGSLITASKLLYDQVQEKNVEIAKLQSSLVAEQNKTLEWKATFDKLQADYAESTAEVARLNNINGALYVKHEKAKIELEDFKKRRNVVLGKPKLVEKMANRATKKVFDDLSCATGDDKCGEEK